MASFETYFSWGEPSNPLEAPLKSDLPICRLSISQKEGEVAIARLLVPRLGPGIGMEKPSSSRAFIFCRLSNGETKLIFKGHLLSLPRVLGEEWGELELEATPEDAHQQLRAAMDRLKQPPFWDPLFVDPLILSPSACIEGLAAEAVEVLEARSELFCWDRASSKLKLSNLFEGRRSVDLSASILQGSLKLRAGETPLTAVHVKVSVEWIQEAEGSEDIAPILASLFPEGIINTYSSKDFVQHWPKAGTKLASAGGRSGYVILESHLKSLSFPASTAPLYPAFSPPLRDYDFSRNEPTLKRVKREWYGAKLVLYWHYRQKRREIVEFTLQQSSQGLVGSLRPKIRELTLRLPPLPSSPKASFFLTDRGRGAAEHALEMARAHLAGSARCLEVEATLPFEAGLDLSLDDTIVITHDSIPGGTLRGKLVEYRLTQDQGEASTTIRVLVSPGIQQKKELTSECKESKPESLKKYVDEYVVEENKGPYATPSGIIYEDYRDQKPDKGIFYPESIKGRYLIGHLELSGHPLEQLAKLQEKQYPCCDDLESVLSEIPTRIQLQLSDLRSAEEMIHTVRLVLPEAWSAPKQIQLS